jgi:hypothetical protein
LAYFIMKQFVFTYNPHNTSLFSDTQWGAFFAEYRKKPGFAGVPSRQAKNPMLCMDFLLGATAPRPFNPLRTNRRAAFAERVLVCRPVELYLHKAVLGGLPYYRYPTARPSCRIGRL